MIPSVQSPPLSTPALPSSDLLYLFSCPENKLDRYIAGLSVKDKANLIKECLEHEDSEKGALILKKFDGRRDFFEVLESLLLNEPYTLCLYFNVYAGASPRFWEWLIAKEGDAGFKICTFLELLSRKYLEEPENHAVIDEIVDTLHSTPIPLANLVVENFNSTSFAALLVALQSHPFIKQLEITFYKNIQLDEKNQNLLSLIEELASFGNFFEEGMHPNLKNFLYPPGKGEKIYDAIFEAEDDLPIHMLKIISLAIDETYALAKIKKIDADAVAIILAVKLRGKKTPQEKGLFTSEVLKRLENFELQTLIQTLIDFDASPLPYLLSEADDEHFFDFTEQDTWDDQIVQTNLCHWQEACYVIDKIKNRPGRLEHLLNEATFYVREGEIFAAPPSLIIYKSVLEDALVHGCDEFGLIAEYRKTVPCIPRFLVAAACRSGSYQNLILSLSRYMDEEQLKHLSYALPDEKILGAVELLEKTSSENLQFLLTHVPEHIFDQLTSKTLNDEVKKLELIHQKFNAFRESFNLETSTISDVERIMSSAREMISLRTRYLLSVAQSLNRISPQLINLHKTYSSALSFLTSFEGPDGIYTQCLALLEPEGDDDPLANISPKYLNLITTGTFGGLGIESFKTLLEWGFRSNQDFEILGLNQEGIDRNNRIIERLNALNPLMKPLWKDYLNFNFSPQVQAGKKAALLQAMKNPIDILEVGEMGDKDILSAIHRNNFYNKLKTYLNQCPHMASIWKALNNNNIFSLSQLLERINSRDISFLFNLELISHVGLDLFPAYGLRSVNDFELLGINRERFEKTAQLIGKFNALNPSINPESLWFRYLNIHNQPLQIIESKESLIQAFKFRTLDQLVLYKHIQALILEASTFPGLNATELSILSSKKETPLTEKGINELLSYILHFIHSHDAGNAFKGYVHQSKDMPSIWSRLNRDGIYSLTDLVRAKKLKDKNILYNLDFL